MPHFTSSWHYTCHTLDFCSQKCVKHYRMYNIHQNKSFSHNHLNFIWYDLIILYSKVFFVENFWLNKFSDLSYSHSPLARNLANSVDFALCSIITWVVLSISWALGHRVYVYPILLPSAKVQLQLLKNIEDISYGHFSVWFLGSSKSTGYSAGFRCFGLRAGSLWKGGRG